MGETYSLFAVPAVSLHAHCHRGLRRFISIGCRILYNNRVSRDDPAGANCPTAIANDAGVCHLSIAWTREERPIEGTGWQDAVPGVVMEVEEDKDGPG